MKKRHQSTILITILTISLLASPVKTEAEQYLYDSLGRVQKVIYEDGSYEEYRYDSNGNIKSVKEYAGTEQSGSGNGSGSGTTTQESQGEGAATTTQTPQGEGSGTTAQTPQGEGEGAGTTSQESQGQGEGVGTTTQTSQGEGTGTTTQVSQGEETGTDTLTGSDGGTGSAGGDGSTPDSLFSQAAALIDSVVNDTSKLTEGTVYKKGVFNYKVTSIENRTVQLVSVVKGKQSKKKYTVPAKVRIQGCTLKVTSIGSKAFAKCKKCKKVVLKSKTIKSIHKNAFAGLKKGTVIQVPKKCYKKYVKYIKKSKTYKRLKIKKSLL